jgi:hypothetical protein
VLLVLPARTNARASLDRQGLPGGPERTEGVVEHSELFQEGATHLVRVW